MKNAHVTEKPRFQPCGSCYSGWKRVIRNGISMLEQCECLLKFRGKPVPGRPPADFKSRAAGEDSDEAA